VKLRVTASFVDRPGQSCLPIHVGFAPKADLIDMKPVGSGFFRPNNFLA